MTAYQIVYLLQIIVLVGCIYMTWKARKALNGLGRGLILLFILLIARRVDDVWQIYNEVQTALLSSLVVGVVAYDIWQIYKARDVYAAYLRNRQERIDQLEATRMDSQGRDKWNNV